MVPLVRGDEAWLHERTRSGTCLTDPGKNTANGTQVVLWTRNGSAAEGRTIPQWPARQQPGLRRQSEE